MRIRAGARIAVLVPLLFAAPLAAAAPEPIAFFTLDDTIGSGRNARADATFSLPSDEATNITEYAWRWGDGGDELTPGNATETHAYSAAGVFVVTLRITDDAGRIGFANQTVLVTGDAPDAYFTYTQREERGGLFVEVDGQFSQPSRGATRVVMWEWRWGDAENETFVEGNASDSHFYAAPGNYRMELRVTDDQGRQDTLEQTVFVKSTFFTRMEVVLRSWDGFLLGARMTLYLAIVSTVVGFVLAIAIALLRISQLAALRLPALAYIEVIRGTPFFLQLLIVYLVLPQVGIMLSIVNAGIVALVINTSAYQAEAMRAGIQAIPTGQLEAATGLGMTYVQAMRHVILPQAFRLTLPALGNEFIILLKDTSIVSVIGLFELTKVGQVIAGRTFIIVETFLVVGAVYFAMTYTLSIGLRRLERKLAIPGLGIAGSSS